MNLRLFSLLAAGCLAGCAAPPKVKPSRHLTERQLQSDSYATLYLGADGRVVTKHTQAGRVQSAGYWNGDGVSGAPSIRIDLGAQEAYFYKGGKLVGMSPISSGREGYNTPTGSFRVIQKNANHVSNLYGNFVDSEGNIVVRNVGVHRDKCPPGAHFEGAPMPYFMRVTGAVGMHAGYLPGVPDSHGCIRLPKDMARIFFENAPLGTPVTIVH
jgi:lipoprotein-anchoring transpeptidase ErfK/SrfK